MENTLNSQKKLKIYHRVQKIPYNYNVQMFMRYNSSEIG